MRRGGEIAAVLALLALPACTRIFGLDTPQLAGANDANDDGSDGSMLIDAAPDDVARCYGSFVHVCFTSSPTSAVTLDAAINTDNSPLCAATDQPSLCVIGGSTILVSATVTVTGAKPLVLISTTGPMAIPDTGVIDVGSTRAGRVGAGYTNGPVCDPGQAPTNTGGGGGATFAGTGGAGGDGTGAGGTPGAVVAISTLRGGCGGRKGSGPNSGTNAGDGGKGGGAVMLIAPSISITGGRITAGGAGGSPGAFSANGASGAGGGGSGGMIVIEAETLAVKSGGKLLANGGGGGEGSSLIQVGNPGIDASDSMPANGGNGTNGGDGGQGSYGNTPGNAGATQTSGGGGGGGAGQIRITAAMFTNSGGTISPPQF